ncbi:uncharacterized protein BDV17DRAFT_296611 [Aspergillus undulatus]|uniref:uncharacterized protein n=1 Tax=Aspergillus undulatus TaxID=1810928 RepID=UPI003CCCA68A
MLFTITFLKCNADYQARSLDLQGQKLPVDHEQDQHQSLQQVYGLLDHIDGRNTDSIKQELGSVETKEGRLITFPNTLQHRVSPFSLEDPTRPGHRKILALSLMDPHHCVISSANVPPQRGDWRGESEVAKGTTMSMDEAKAHRLEPMKERGMRPQEANTAFEEGGFCLCEF